MTRNMTSWISNVINAKVKVPMPVLSFPVTKLLEISVSEFLSDSSVQAKGIALAAQRSGSVAALGMMDLSVEAEAFGSNIKFAKEEVPVVIGSIINTIEEAEELVVPEVGTARTGLYIEGISKTLELVTDKPVFAGCIGPFSLAGRLMDVNNALENCYEDPEFVELAVAKAAEFIMKYLLAYKEAGANGVVMAEPLTGLLSPKLASQFSHPFVRDIIETVQDDNFIVIYHNCGGNAGLMAEDLFALGARGYHFGNAINLRDVLEKAPQDVAIFGNLDPLEFMNGTPESITYKTAVLMAECGEFKNFIPSSGCDIPPASKWDNIDAFFSCVNKYYTERL